MALLSMSFAMCVPLSGRICHRNSVALAPFLCHVFDKIHLQKRSHLRVFYPLWDEVSRKAKNACISAGIMVILHLRSYEDDLF